MLADTLWLGVITTAVSLLLGYPLAYHLALTRSRWKPLLIVFILSPLLVGIVIRCYGWMILLADRGLINETLVQRGWLSKPLPLMYNKFGVVIALVHVFLPFMVLSLTGVLKRIEPQLIEASQTLGASPRRAFFEVTLPLSLPGILAGSLLVFSLAISSFVVPILVGGFKVHVLPMVVYEQILSVFDWPFGGAAPDLGGPDRRLHQGDRARAPRDRVILRAVVGLVYAFLLLPMVIVVLAAFNAGNYFTFPPQGFSLKWFANFFQRREFMQALRLSTELAFWTAMPSTVIGTAAAIALVRGRFRGRDLLNAFVTSPLLLPQILTGVALLQFYTLLKMQASYAALLIGHIVVTTPYVIRTVTATLTHFDVALEEAAQSLGAHPVRAFFEITLGVIKPGVAAGAIFAFAISFDNFTLSLFLTSSKLTPLPIELFAYLKYSFDPTAAAVSAFAIGVALVLVLGIARFMGLEEFTGF